MADRPVVFDRAAAHLDAVRAAGLPDHQAYVHGGLFFGWAVDRGLVARWVEDGAPDAFAEYRARRITGPTLLARLDGALIDDQFTDEGLAFVAGYLDPRVGSYVDDWLRTVAAGLPSEYHVPDDAESAARVSALLDARFAEWRTSWDGARPDLRGDDAEGRALPDRLEVPVVPITSGIPLPGGPLGIRAARPQTRAAVAAAVGGERRVALIPTAIPGRAASPAPDDLAEVGVLAEIQRVAPAADRPDAEDVLVQCVARVEVAGWIAGGALRAAVRVVAEPEPTEDEAARIEELRRAAADVARRRRSRGDPPGRVALAAVLPGPALLDVLAADLPAGRDERRLVLEAPDLGTRIDVVAALLAREP